MQALDLNASPTRYNEDNDEIGEWEATLAATSSGWTLDAPTAIGAMPGMGKLTSIIVNNNLIKAATQEMADLAIGIIQTHMMSIWEEPSG